MTRRDFLIPLLILLIAAVARLIFLDIKPPHFDEGINGWWCDQMAAQGFYKYDPANYHGPFHFYVLRVFLTLFGRNLWALRMPTVLVGIGCVGLAFLFTRFFGKTPTYLAAFAMAISPAFIFYERYAIHETWLVFFLLITLWGLLSWYSAATPRAIWATIMGVTGMILTKETYIIHLVAFALAALCSWILGLVRPPSEPIKRIPGPTPWVHVSAALAVGLVLILFFYSGNFLNWPGITGLYRTFSHWANTGVGSQSGHEKPDYDISIVPHFLRNIPILVFLAKIKINWYWIKLLAVYEWFAIAGLVFSIRYLFGGNGALRYLAIYALGVLVAYSVIAYKTPWCIISIEWPFLFLAGACLVFLWDIFPRYAKPVAIAGALPLLGLMAYRSYLLNYVRFDDPKEMYAYVQTYRDYRKFVDPILEKGQKDPAAKSRIQGLILLKSYFPIPWVIDEFPHVAYYEHGEEKWPPNLDADFIAVDDSESEDLEYQLKNRYFVTEFRLRDGMDPCRAYFRYETFKDIFPGRVPEFEPAASGSSKE
jgi:uncharacterized protein (TIGR03663 family)